MINEEEEGIGPNIFPMLLEMFPNKEPRRATFEDIERIKTLFLIGKVPIDVNNRLHVIEAIKLLEKIGLLTLSTVDAKLYVGNVYNGKE